MDTAKLFTVLCAFLLLICLTLSITSVVVLHNAVAEGEAFYQRAQLLVGDLADAIPVIKNETLPEESTETDVLYNPFCIKETDGKIGIFCEEGYLVRLIDTPVSTLPKQEREALKEGIRVNSWKELLERIQNYT